MPFASIVLLCQIEESPMPLPDGTISIPELAERINSLRDSL